MPYFRPTSPAWIARAAAFSLAAACGGGTASAQLREPQVLVVYDSRIADSLAVAEYYAGSVKVTGGAGSIAGVRPRVEVLDISTRTIMGGGSPAGVFPAAPDISYSTFKIQLRDPLRTYLIQSGLTHRVRCIVLTKGLPHRILNISSVSPMNPTIGDNPGQLSTALNAGQSGNITYCSVDSELTLLHQSLDLGEANANADSRADGMICNPYWRATTTINGYTTRNILTTKTFSVPGSGYNGFFWLNLANTNFTTALIPGDITLVCRLDGNTVAAVTGMIDRAQNIVVPMNTARLVLDSDGGTIDGSSSPGVTGALDGGPDYTQTRNTLVADGRFPVANINSNTAGGFTGFIVGPNADYSAANNGPPIVFSPQVLLLASFGANHTGVSNNGSSAWTTYGTSFNFLPGAVFNSIESYNGRAFGGHAGNPFVPQQQAADVLAAGGGRATFGLANVWEPFALSTADNEPVARNFFLGSMTWAEAAYSAIPAISWQQIVIGDPLARVRRDREDIDADGRVGIDDLYAWHGSPVDLNNSGSTADTDSHILRDLRLLEASVRGHETATMKADQR